MASRSFPFPHSARARRGNASGAGLPRPRLALTAVVVLAMLAGGWWWLRESSVAAVREVSVTGLAGTQAPAIRAALTSAAQDMTTLHVKEELLRTAVERYPVVADVRAEGDFPHRLRITVTERTPVASLQAGGRAIPVAADGTLLRGAGAAGLPAVSLPGPPAGTQLRDPLAAAQVRILAAAPAALRRTVTKTFTGSRGLALQLRDGPVVAFGAPERLAAKWTALAAVLADPASAGGTLIDLSVPERPAVAGLAPLLPAGAVDEDGDGVPDPAATPVPPASQPASPTSPAVTP